MRNIIQNKTLCLRLANAIEDNGSEILRRSAFVDRKDVRTQIQCNIDTLRHRLSELESEINDQSNWKE